MKSKFMLGLALGILVTLGLGLTMGSSRGEQEEPSGAIQRHIVHDNKQTFVWEVDKQQRVVGVEVYTIGYPQEVLARKRYDLKQ